jgi:murein DD-endopeptidase MepM/ murein hydrolase activator NlpD
MQPYSLRDRGPARRRRRILVIAACAVLLVVLLLALRVGDPPRVELATSVPGIGRSTEVVADAAVAGRGLGDLRLELAQGERIVTLVQRDHDPRPFWAFWGPRVETDRLEATVGRDSLEGLEEGTATLRVVAERAGTWIRRPAPLVVERELPVRFRAPTLEVLSSLIYVAQGGSEAVAYRVGESASIHGVRAGTTFFPGFELPGGAPGERFVIFAVAHDVPDASMVRLVAADALGNEATVSFLDRFFPKRYPASTIELSDAFLERVVPPIVSQTAGVAAGESLLDTYLLINRDLRQRNAERLFELGRDTAEQFLWREPFRQQPNTKVMDHFAAYRTYLYAGREVDQQVHLGFDLASVRRAEVLASNRGRVVLAEYLGIYGNTVVLDHGYGLMSLYAHLSSIEVQAGQMLERGQVLGRSGETGLAGGDHLHFTTMIRGVPVDPAEWFDGHWITDRIVAKLGTLLQLEGG